MAKQLTTRIKNKHDIEANWAQAVNFIPLDGEIIIYDAEPAEGFPFPRIKIGDGQTVVSDLPFLSHVTTDEVQAEVNNLITVGTSDPTAETDGQFYFKYGE